MAKKKSSQKRPRHGTAKPKDAPPAPAAVWDSVEVEFFAREADLYRVGTVESFDDLDKD